MPSQILLGQTGQIVQPGVRCQCFVTVVVKGGTMHLVGARFQRNVDHRTGGAAKFSRVAVGLDFELTDRIRRWAHYFGGK